MDMVGLGKTHKTRERNDRASASSDNSGSHKQVVTNSRGAVDLNAEWESFEKLIGENTPADSAPQAVNPTLPEPVPKPAKMSSHKKDKDMLNQHSEGGGNAQDDASEDGKEESSDSDSDSDSSSESENSSDENDSDSDEEEKNVSTEIAKEDGESSDSSDEEDSENSDSEDGSEQATSSESSEDEENEKNKLSERQQAENDSKVDRSHSDKGRASQSRRDTRSPSPPKTHSRRSRSRSGSRSKSSKHRRRRDSSSHRDKRRRDSSRDRKHRRNSHRRRRSRSRDRKYRHRTRSRSRSRSRRHRDRSRDRRRRRRSRSHSGDRNHRSHHHSRRHRRSRSRDRSRDRRHRKSPERYEAKRPDKKPMSYKESLRQKLLAAQKQANEGKLELTNNVAKELMTPKEKPSALPLNTIHPLMSIDTGLGGDKVTPQQALSQTMAAMHQKAQQLTGVAVPKYYNPAAVNPLKFAEQVKKRKLLWSKKEDGASTSTTTIPSAPTTTTTTTNIPSAPVSGSSTVGEVGGNNSLKNPWQGTAFIQDDDGKVAAKFRKLMGIKPGEGASDGESNQNPVAKEQIQKQQQLFHQLDREYEFARMTTHTHRGVGLGFGTQGFHESK